MIKQKKKVITEISGGGIVYKFKVKSYSSKFPEEKPSAFYGASKVKSSKSSVQSKIGIILLQLDNGRWCLPKGLVEKGEHMKEVALREAKEETGLEHLRIGEKIGQEHFFYFWKEDNTYHNKFVYYFLIEFIGTEEPKPQKEEGFTKAGWMDIDEALELVKYKETKNIIQRARKMLSKDLKYEQKQQLRLSY